MLLFEEIKFCKIDFLSNASVAKAMQVLQVSIPVPVLTNVNSYQ